MKIINKILQIFIFPILLGLIGISVWCFLYGDFSEETGYQIGVAKKVNKPKVDCDNLSNSRQLLVYNLATNFVKKSLNESSTAEFPNTKEKLRHIKYLGKNKYQINSWVDSRDTYGAMTRRNFSFVFKLNGSHVIAEKFVIKEYGYIPK